ncbi:MAG: aldehyde dehydrogenase family protein [bacterium]|nr:aldehyde dehydrogenase family protein [bacterium]
MKKLDITGLINNSVIAAKKFSEFDQKKTDCILKAVYKAAFYNRVNLAKESYEETGIGKLEDKIIKNIVATNLVYNDIKELKTVGIINEDHEAGIVKIAKPLGPIFAITPITNPTSTVLFKILISIKTRNPLIISPHGGAKKSTIKSAEICYRAAIEAGAPENCIQWISRATKDEIIELMGHRKVAMILATGSVGLVKAAFSSGNPAIGVGPGNVPVFIGKSADVDFSVEQILKSKTFDNGTICASEQAIVLQKYNAYKIIEAFKKRNAYFLNKEEIKKLEPVAFNKTSKSMNVSVIGQAAHKIAKLAGFIVPEETSVLIAELDKVGIESPLSLEILAPILAMYIVDDIEAGMYKCKEINQNGGLGHTISIFSNKMEKVYRYSHLLNSGRVIVNTPSSQGAIGGLYNSLQPSFTLACGTGGKNITTDNISAKHLLNIQRIALRHETPYLEHLSKSFFSDDKINVDYFDELCNTNKS